jgi:uncharacterized cupin superfamily protein
MDVILLLVLLFASCVMQVAAFQRRSFAIAKTAFSRSSTQITMSTPTNEIKVISQASDDDIAKLRCRSWPTWGCGVSKFPWSYGDTETCLLISGKVTVTPTNGTPVTIQKGDIATFPAGMSCTWDVTEAIQKHYNFS